MEFTLDWEKGESRLTSVYYRREPGTQSLPERSAAPEQVVVLPVADEHVVPLGASRSSAEPVMRAVGP